MPDADAMFNFPLIFIMNVFWLLALSVTLIWILVAIYKYGWKQKLFYLMATVSIVNQIGFVSTFLVFTQILNKEISRIQVLSVIEKLELLEYANYLTKCVFSNGLNNC